MCLIFKHNNEKENNNDLNQTIKKGNNEKKDKLLNVDNNYLDIKNTRINNVLYGANKDLKNTLIDKLKKLKEFVYSKEYNSISNLLLKGFPEVVSNEYILFSGKIFLRWEECH